MYKTSGSGALSGKSTHRRKDYVLSTEYKKRHNAVPKRIHVNPLTKGDVFSTEKHLRQQMAQQRAVRILSFLIGLSLVFVVSAGILYRYSVIMEMNYANIKIEREIRRMQDETNLIRENLSGKTDLNVVRTLAVEKLLMQDPSQKQLIRVVIPQSDQLIVDDQSLHANVTDRDMDAVYTNLEGFFKKLR
jgi:hypothetical protein